MEETSSSICFPVPHPSQAPQRADHSRHQLHGADDLLSLYNLKPLWERSVKLYMGSARNKQKIGAATHADDTKPVAAQTLADPGNKPGEDSSATVAGDEKPLVMEKTYLNYVKDLPGQVRPPRRTINKYNAAVAAASSSGGPIPSLPVELTGRTTMREIVFRPETTMQRVAPFDEESLQAAFTVEAGPVSDIDLSLLESDEVDRQTPQKRKKKRKHQRDNTGDKTDEIAAKRSKLNAIVRKQ